MHNISFIYFIRKYFVIQKHLLHLSSNFFNKTKQKKTHPPSSQENDSFRNEFHFKETVKRRPNIPKEKARGKREHANDAAPLISGET